ncbi:MAG: TonB-dependent receptor plug domain-containing protein [Desulfobacterales bacterium]|nr:TonB-dependent receptor plug domain-containing protein [Desulfobacterales bacterium]
MAAALRPLALVVGSMLLAATSVVWAAGDSQTGPRPRRDLTQLSIEELMDIEITSVSKKAQKLSEAAAAVYVITQEDIRRSGVTSIPEALRMVPGVQVAHLDANKWAVTVRGFNGRFANKLLVLMDGRSLYTPLFSGVFWEMQDTLLEDIERIEVIRGPGATLWGANAVNGVINIITKKAQDTQGMLAVGGGGTEERGFGSLRYGGSIGDSGHYRIYTKYFDRDGGVDLDGNNASDDWNMFRAGFRSDWAFAGRDDTGGVGCRTS